MGCGSSTSSKTAPGPPDYEQHVSLINHEGVSPPPSAPQEPVISFAANLGLYGSCKFKGKEAEKYLKKTGAPANTLENPKWTSDPALADKVAAAVLEWAKDHGARKPQPRSFLAALDEPWRRRSRSQAQRCARTSSNLSALAACASARLARSTTPCSTSRWTARSATPLTARNC